MAFNKIAGAFVDQSLDNYLPSIKSNTSINDNLWYTYNNNSATPINGTGTSNLIVSTTETNGLRISKNNSSFFGHGISSSFAIAKRHLAKVLQIVFDVEFISGNYSKGDIKVYIIANPDTSPILIEPVNVEISTGVAGFSIRHIASFQTHITITSYKICLHIANTNTSAYTLEFSNFKVWEPVQSLGAVITDWQSYTPTYGTFTSVNTHYARFRRVGSCVEIEGHFTVSNLGNGGTMTIGLPNGLSIDSSIGTSRVVYGNVIQNQFALTNSPYYLVADRGVSTSALIIVVQATSTRNPYYNLESNVAFSGNPILSFSASVPIQGWGSNVAMSSDTGDGRVVAFRASLITGVGSSATIGSSGATIEYDTHGTWSSGIYTIPISGVYRFTVFVRGTTGNATWQFSKNGTSRILGTTVSGHQYAQFSGSDRFNAGQTLSFSTNDTTVTDSINFISIERISAGSQQIAATETVACSYWLTSNTASNTNPIPFGGPTGSVGRIYDTHGSMINGTFTAPVNGIYLVTGHIPTGTTGGWIEIWIDGLQNRRRFLLDSDSYAKNVYIQLRLLAGQTLQLRPYTAFTVSGGTLDSGGASQIEISRITL